MKGNAAVSSADDRIADIAELLALALTRLRAGKSSQTLGFDP